MKTGSKLATLALSSGLAVAGFAGIATPAQAADTATTFTISGGTLSLSVPATANLGAVATGTLVALGQLGPVTVADTRGSLVNTWTTTVTSSAFVTGVGTAPHQVVTEPNVAYLSGPFTAHTGLGTFVPGTKSPAPLYTGLAGNSSTTWDPTITMTLLSSQVAGAYTGTVTHSVA
jgi:hypothetical protein